MRKLLSVIMSAIFSISLFPTVYALEISDSEAVDVLKVIGQAKQIANIADESNDYSVLIPVAQEYYEIVFPTLSTDDVLTILDGEEYGNAYKAMVIDLYSMYRIEAQDVETISIDDIDKKLLSFIEPDSGLSVMAMASISDISLLSKTKLEEMIGDGTDSEKVISLRLLCNQYPDVAAKLVEDVLLEGNENSILYDAAINFLPRINEKISVFSEEEIVSLISGILNSTESEKIKITCVQALLEIDTALASDAVNRCRENIPAELLNYYCQRTTVENDDLVSFTAIKMASTPTTYGTSNRLGNALYRDGVNFYIGTDWHAGLVGHASGPFYQNGAWVIHHPGGDNVVQYGTFIEFLTDKNGVRHNDMGEFYLSSVSQSTAYNIFFTAHDLTNEGIAYTFSPMLRTSKSSGKIEPSDITKIRCDGVVEYCYEYNGVRLQGPNDSTNTWDISTVIGAEYHPATYLPSAQAQCFNREVSH